MGKILSRLVCCGETESRPDTPTRKRREPIVDRASIVVKTNSELEREELQTAIRYFI